MTMLPLVGDYGCVGILCHIALLKLSQLHLRFICFMLINVVVGLCFNLCCNLS